MAGFFSAICAKLICCGSSHDDVVQPTTPKGAESSLLRAVKEGFFDDVKAALSEFDVNEPLPPTTRELFNNIFFAAESDVDNFTSEVKEALIDFLIKRDDFSSEEIFINGQTLPELLKDADKRNDTALATFLFAQLNKKNTVKFDDTETPTYRGISSYSEENFTGRIYDRNISSTPSGHRSSTSTPINPGPTLRNTRANSVDNLSSQNISQLVSANKVAEAFIVPTVVKKFNLLIVDDTPTQAKMHIRKLIDCNIDIYWVDTPEESLKAMRGENFSSAGRCISSLEERNVKYTSEQNPSIKFDVVLHDFDLGKGKKTGPEVVAEYRATENLSTRLPIFAFSSDINTINKPLKDVHQPVNFDGIADKPGTAKQTLTALHAILGDEYIQMPEIKIDERNTSPSIFF